MICLLDIFTLTDHRGIPQIKVPYQEEHFQRFPANHNLKHYPESQEVMLRNLLKSIGSILQKEISIKKFLMVGLSETRIQIHQLDQIQMPVTDRQQKEDHPKSLLSDVMILKVQIYQAKHKNMTGVAVRETPVG